MGWIKLTGLGRHWSEARLDALAPGDHLLRITTTNVTSFRIQKALASGRRLQVDGTHLEVPEPGDAFSLHRERGREGRWRWGDPPGDGWRKRPGLQGPIDDAFRAPFLVVTPSGTSSQPELDRWVAFELAHFKTRWRALFRGELRMVTDREVTEEHMRQYHLVLFGTPESNRLIPQALRNTALAWPSSKNEILLGIHPNPKAKGRYVVLNSGPTFREADDRTNSLQNPKLGDWAIIDITEPPSAARPGRIVRAGFFDEQWQLP